MCGLNLAPAEGQHSETSTCLEWWEGWAGKGWKKGALAGSHTWDGARKPGCVTLKSVFRTLREGLGY